MSATTGPYKPGQGFAIARAVKRKDNDPDYSGTANIEGCGEFAISLWIKPHGLSILTRRFDQTKISSRLKVEKK